MGTSFVTLVRKHASWIATNSPLFLSDTFRGPSKGDCASADDDSGFVHESSLASGLELKEPASP